MARGKTDHLKKHQFKKGQSGNAKGRAIGDVSLTAMVKRFLAKDDKRLCEVLVRSAIKQAAEGNIACLKEIWARVDGPIEQQIRIVQEIDFIFQVALDVLEADQFKKFVDAVASARESPTDTSSAGLDRVH